MASNEGVEVCNEDSQGCRSEEVEEMFRNARARISELELEVENGKKEYAALKDKFEELEGQKTVLEQELKNLRERIDPSSADARQIGFSGQDDVMQMKHGAEEESNDFLLRAEIKVLECEKVKAEEDVRLWKQRYSELELQVLQSGGIGMLAKGWSIGDTQEKNLHGAGRSFHQSPVEEKAREFVVEHFCGTPSQAVDLRSEAGNNLIPARCSADIRKQLMFKEESPVRKIAPSTPSAVKPTSIRVINVSDSENDSDGNDVQMASPGLSTGKRKRAANIITSDSESEDDHLPISLLKKQHFQGSKDYATSSDDMHCSMSAQTPSRRRFVSLRQREKLHGRENSCPRKQTSARYGQGIHTIYEIEDDESEDVEMDSEGESLAGFIVNDSDVSDSGGGNNHSEESAGEDGVSQLEECDANDGSAQLDDTLDGDMREILAVISRSKDRESKWEFEADMLADFGKIPKLCMMAVCALCRLQTSEEQASKSTYHYNKQGFSQPDAYKGTTLAMFLTDGDLAGDVKKTVRELEEYDPKGLEVCRDLATKYSKQLFKMYQNKEDPLFRPLDVGRDRKS